MEPKTAARLVTESIGRLFFSAENQQRFHGTADELGIAPPMLKALLELVPGEPRPMRDLAELWECDASFVTVTCDGLEAKGLVERRVADHDRRVKLVALTPAGVEAQARAADQVYGPRAGFAALTPSEQRSLARLLVKFADAQETHDRDVGTDPKARGMARQLAAQRTREFRTQPASPGREPGDADLQAQRRELAELRDELVRLRDDLKAQVREPIDHAKAVKAEVKADVKATKAGIKADVKATTAGIKARARRPVDQVKAAKADAKARIKGSRREVADPDGGDDGGDVGHPGRTERRR